MNLSTSTIAPNWLKEPKDLNALEPNLWPENLSRDSSGELVLAGNKLSQLVSSYGSPLMVIDQEDFFTRARKVKLAFENAAREVGTSCKVYYAGKSLLTTEIARWVGELGLNLDVSTGGELAVALRAGFPANRIGLHGNNKSLYEISRAVTSGVGAIVIDSEVEIERIASIAVAQEKNQAVRLRVNSGVHANTHEYLATAREDQKFGVALDEVEGLVAKIRSHSNLTFLGLHSHIGSQIFSVEGFIESVRRLLPLHAALLSVGEVPEINLGGGFGINYTSADSAMAIEDFAREIAAAVKQQCDELGIPIPVLCFEPGRVISGPSGITVYNVGTIKDVRLENGVVRKYVSVDGGMSDNLRPALYKADYTAKLASRASQSSPALSRVVGKHCESGDVVVRDCYLPGDIAPNDLLVVAATGAYCNSLASNYNYLTRPAVVAVADGESKVLLRAETETDMFARDVGFNPELTE